MTRGRRLPAVATASRFVSPVPARAFLALVLLATGCSTALPSAVPPSDRVETTTSSPAPSRVPFPQITPFIPPTASIRPDPEPECLALRAVIGPTFEPTTASAGFYRWSVHPVMMAFAISRVTERADPDMVWTREPTEPNLREPGFLPGGADLTTGIRPGKYGRQRLPVEIVEANATLELDGGGTRKLRTRVVTSAYGDSRILLRIPNSGANGVLRISAEWQDRCLRYVGAASARVTIIPAAVVAGCPIDSGDDLGTYLDTLKQPRPDIGGVPITLLTSTVTWIWKRGAIAADYDPLHTWDRDEPAVVGLAGSRVRVDDRNPNLIFTDLGASFYRRADVASWLRGGRQPTAVEGRHPDPASDGSFLLRLPDAPGRYVAVGLIGWESACLTGQFLAVFSVDAE